MAAMAEIMKVTMIHRVGGCGVLGPERSMKKEGWENIMFYGYTGSIVVAVIAYVNKEDTT